MSKIVKVSKINVEVVLANKKMQELKKQSNMTDEEFEKEVNSASSFKLGGFGSFFGVPNLFKGINFVDILKKNESSDVYLDLSKVLAIGTPSKIDGVDIEIFPIYFSSNTKDCWMIDVKDFEKVLQVF